jgi:hypothetical protein
MVVPGGAVIAFCHCEAASQTNSHQLLTWALLSHYGVIGFDDHLKNPKMTKDAQE